jgi:hypothetical protein
MFVQAAPPVSASLTLMKLEKRQIQKQTEKLKWNNTEKLLWRKMEKTKQMEKQTEKPKLNNTEKLLQRKMDKTNWTEKLMLTKMEKLIQNKTGFEGMAEEEE